MSLLKTRSVDQIPQDLKLLWQKCERAYPHFRNLWSTMVHSPIVFKHVWGQLIDMKEQSPVENKHFELIVVVVSRLTALNYSVSNHAPRLADYGYSDEQINRLEELELSDHPAWTYDDHFDERDNLVIDLTYHLIWTGTYGHSHKVHHRIIRENRQRIFKELQKHFSTQQIEELVWRATQSAAFNWHNDFFEISLFEPGNLPAPTMK